VAQDRLQWRDLVNTVRNVWFPYEQLKSNQLPEETLLHE